MFTRLTTAANRMQAAMGVGTVVRQTCLARLMCVLLFAKKRMLTKFLISFIFALEKIFNSSWLRFQEFPVTKV